MLILELVRWLAVVLLAGSTSTEFKCLQFKVPNQNRKYKTNSGYLAMGYIDPPASNAWRTTAMLDIRVFLHTARIELAATAALSHTRDVLLTCRTSQLQ